MQQGAILAILVLTIGSVVGIDAFQSLLPISTFKSRQSSYLSTMDKQNVNDETMVDRYEKMPLPDRGKENGHAIFGLLMGDKMIESYDIYKRPDDSDEVDVIIAFIQFGNKVDGHPGVVHGGILSLMFDDSLGFAYEALGVEMAFTANLTVDFRKPVLSGTKVRVAAQLENREGRKLYWKAQMTSMDQSTLYAEASSLYIIPK